MKTAPAGVATFVASSNVGFRADLYTLTLLDGSVFRWTTCDVDIKVGVNTWVSAGPVLGRGNYRSTSRLEVDTLEIRLAGGFLHLGKSMGLRAVQGYFDEARLQVDHLVGPDLPGALALGPILAMYEGRVAGVDPGAPVTKVLVQSEIAALTGGTGQLPRFLFQTGCRNAVYDPNCGLVKATFTLTGTASGVPTTTTIPTASAALTAKAAGYFNLGLLSITSGALAGTRRAIRSWDGTTFTLTVPLPAAPAAGDAISAYPGCARTQADCTTKFVNIGNFRGYPHMPTTEGGF